jgi:hypothetical protein
MSDSRLKNSEPKPQARALRPLLDPRLGDVEDDASSTKQRSLLGIAGSLLAEISLPKLAVAWGLLIILPGILLGLAPLIGSVWVAALSRKIVAPLSGLWPFLALIILAVLGWIAGRSLMRAAEQAFWSLNALAVQPGYTLCREGLRSAEWAEFLAALGRYPQLAERTVILPGNHDTNVVDRANPARLDLPTSPGGRLRQMRTLSAMMAVQGDRVRVIDPKTGCLGATLSRATAPHRHAIAAFADAGGLRLQIELARVWADAFPMVLAPDADDGLGVIILNSSAETHFSFTNALGLMTAEQARGLAAVARELPRARWIVALHHHVVEYPRPAKAFSERIGTALINGSWFVRQLQPFGRRVVVMHGHRHIDWIGACGSLRIVSAPSPVMEATDGEPTCCYIHTLAAGPEGSAVPVGAGARGYRRGRRTQLGRRERAVLACLPLSARRRAARQANGWRDAARRR